jgi:hypothetical protein
MAYLIGLFLVLALVFSAASGSNILSDLKAKFTEAVFPKSETEITIENLKNDYQLLEEFFSSSAPELMNSKEIKPVEKAALEKAATAFESSKQLVGTLEQLTKDDKSLLGATVEKILGLDKKPVLEPTHIPPQCQLVCGE